MLDRRRVRSWACRGSRWCGLGESRGGCVRPPSKYASPPCTPAYNHCLSICSMIWNVIQALSRRVYGWQIWRWKALSLTLNTEDLLGSWVTLVMWRMKVDVIQYHVEVKKVKVVIIYGWGGDLTGQFVFEMSERHLWPSDFGKQRPQLLQCSYFSLPPTLVDTFVGGKKH